MSDTPTETPVTGEDILAAADAWRQEGEEVALATVVETWGSSPRPPGSRLAVSGSGRLAGSVSGGCIESAVAEVAQAVMRDGQPQLLDFGISDERAWEVGLACGGKLKVFVEKLA
ncbi:XdhC family protein [Roseomonas gilardii]|uniref:XdhC family protein n=1 Tax=Roseomonas gilardii TaxID=257708 RepID=UPI000688630B|nr:XdhC family protein [Roseomonas gilardii]SUE44148.1 xanthine dehydrogenase accessory protein XdhC [Roseomonas gilardii subsp. rosea]